MRIQAHPHDSFETLERRREIADIVSKLMVGDSYSGTSSPFGGDTYVWTVDRLRYWQVHFDKENPQVMWIKHYDNLKQMELSLMLWLACNIRGCVELTSDEQTGELKPFVSSLAKFLKGERT